MSNWRVKLYRSGEDDPYVSCLVWEKSATDAENWARGYFKISDKIRVVAEEV